MKKLVLYVLALLAVFACSAPDLKKYQSTDEDTQKTRSFFDHTDRMGRRH
jgi:hypothetical protein